jgi:hypothetical protein
MEEAGKEIGRGAQVGAVPPALTILDLPTSLIEACLSHLPAVSDLRACASTCTILRSIVDQGNWVGAKEVCVHKWAPLLNEQCQWIGAHCPMVRDPAACVRWDWLDDMKIKPSFLHIRGKLCMHACMHSQTHLLREGRTPIHPFLHRPSHSAGLPASSCPPWTSPTFPALRVMGGSNC